MKNLSKQLLMILAGLLIFVHAALGQGTAPTEYSAELVFAEPPARYYILASNDIVSIDSTGVQAVVGKKLDKKYWKEGGFIIELNETEYAIDGNDFIWAREGQFLSTVGNLLERK